MLEYALSYMHNRCILYIYREHETDGSTYPRCGKGSFAEAQLPEGERDAPRAGHSQLGSLARGTPRDERSGKKVNHWPRAGLLPIRHTMEETHKSPVF